MNKKVIASLFVFLATGMSGCIGGSDDGVAYERIITGRLLDARGNPIDKALITIEQDQSDFRDSDPDTVTDRSGDFSFRIRLVGPEIKFLIADAGSPEVRTVVPIRADRESKVGIKIVKSGANVDLQQSVDAALLPSPNCDLVFSPETDLKQIALTDERCLVQASAIVQGSRAANISMTATAERCPVEIDCPRTESSTVENGLIFELVRGVNDEFCDYKVEYRNSSNELLQTVRLRSTAERLVRCD